MLRHLAMAYRNAEIFTFERVAASRGSAMVGLRRAETAGRRCLKLPFGELRQRLVNAPSVLRTAAHCDAGFPSALLRHLAMAYRNAEIFTFERVAASRGSAMAAVFGLG